MRRKYIAVLRDQYRSRGLFWVARQAERYCRILLSAARKRTLTGPISAVIMPTYRCNHRCVMCDFPSRHRPDSREMSTSQIKDLLNELAELPSSGVSFYGGEPLVRPDVIELMEHAHRTGMLVHLATNGYLIDREMAGRIIRAGTDAVSVSLDGATAPVHDRQRGAGGAYERAVNAIRYLAESKRSSGAAVRIVATTILTPDNLEETGEIVNLGMSLGADSHTLYEAQPLLSISNKLNVEEITRFREANRMIGRLKSEYPDYIDNSIEYIRIVDRLLAGKSVRLKCFAPYTDLFIDPYGNLYPCNHLLGMDMPQGRYQPGRLKELWYSDDYQKARNRLTDCADCDYMCHRELSLIFNRFWPSGKRPFFSYYGQPAARNSR